MRKADKDRMARVIVNNLGENQAGRPIFVGLNGKSYIFKDGEPMDVPAGVLDILDHAVIEVPVRDVNGILLAIDGEPLGDRPQHMQKTIKKKRYAVQVLKYPEKRPGAKTKKEKEKAAALETQEEEKKEMSEKIKELDEAPLYEEEDEHIADNNED